MYENDVIKGYHGESDEIEKEIQGKFWSDVEQ